MLQASVIRLTVSKQRINVCDLFNLVVAPSHETEEHHCTKTIQLFVNSKKIACTGKSLMTQMIISVGKN